MKDVFYNVQLTPTTPTTALQATSSGITTTILLNNNNSNNKYFITPGLSTTTSINSNMTNNICSSESFSILPPPHHDMLSANSIELNAAASLSDDSGVPLTTNSSISSGDSYRLGMCKLEIELGESDGEVSQFDSLDNCSEGGMSAENFNTLKKGPLAPIDPPPEFQDSPQATLVRSISKNIFNSLRRWTSSQSSFEHLKDHGYNNENDNENCENGELTLTIKRSDHKHDNKLQLQQQPTQHQHHCTQQQRVLNSCSNEDLASYSQQNYYPQSAEVAVDFANITIQDYSESNRCLRDAYAINKHLYSSDSILNSHTENIYDEPNNVGSNSLGNSVDVFDDSEIAVAAAVGDAESVSPSLPPPPPPVSIVKIKQTLCPYYQDHTRYFKAIPSEQDNITSAAQRFDLSGLSEIHDYDLYYGSSRRNTYHQQYDTYLQRKLLSPLNLTTLHHCHHHGHYYAGVNSYSNRPNSRNSLNSRLSSSYNSLSMSSSNKPDDSIFITQAMSHDALLTREISDFYNVPIDSDIYAFPVDMIKTDKNCCLHQHKQRLHKTNNNNNLKNNIKNMKCNNNSNNNETATKKNTDFIFMEHNGSHTSQHNHHNKLARRINRNKRKKRNANINNNNLINNSNAEDTDDGRFTNKYRTPVHCSTMDAKVNACCGGIPIGTIKGYIGTGSDENGLLSDEVATITTTITTNAISSAQEPLHMTLDEVKQFYHTLYSDGLTTTTTTMTRTTTQRTTSAAAAAAAAAAASSAAAVGSTTLLQRLHQCNKTNATKSSNETIWSSSSTHSRSKNANNNNTNNNNNNNNNTNNLSSNSSNHSGCSNNNNNKHTSKSTNKQKLLLNNENNNNIVGVHNHQSSQVSSSLNCVEEHKQQHYHHHSNQQQQQPQQNHSNSEVKKSQFTLNLKQKFCSIFRFRKNYRGCRRNSGVSDADDNNRSGSGQIEEKRKKFQSRALPPLPKKAIDGACDVSGVIVDCGESGSTKGGTGEVMSGTLAIAANTAAFDTNKKTATRAFQFTSSIEKVKDYGWYWGPLSSEAAEKVLSNEPDGSFIVRDSSDDHYIFSLSFKLNNCVRHVRIEQDQGTFSFGSYAKFKSQTITEFIEKAVEHSRSGRYLFFLHRRPEHGPMRVQLTNPVSRFKHVQSLQHMCRFVILKTVIRKDLIQTLPLPRRLLDYLNYKHCYSEQVESDSTHSQASGDGSI